MRHKYDTRGIVLSRAPFGETHARLAILTEEVGLVFARASGVRRKESKLAHALVTLAESDLVLVEGREGWRVAGAVLAENWFLRMRAADARRAAARVVGLALRLSSTDAREANLYPLMRDFFEALSRDEAPSDGAELVAAAGVLATLGWSDERMGGVGTPFSDENLARVALERERYVILINRGITASGL